MAVTEDLNRGSGNVGDISPPFASAFHAHFRVDVRVLARLWAFARTLDGALLRGACAHDVRDRGISVFARGFHGLASGRAGMPWQGVALWVAHYTEQRAYMT